MRWWWLRVDQVGAWSIGELKAAGAILITFAGMAMCITLLTSFYLHRLGFGSEGRFIGAVLIVTISSTKFRRVAGELFPKTTMMGDRLAAERLGFAGSLSSASPSRGRLWWLDRWGYRWSREEQYVRNVIWLVAMTIFVPAALFGPVYLQRYFDFGKRVSILGIFITVLPLAFYAGRRFCVCRWPDLVRTADCNAVMRLNKSPMPRHEGHGEER
jgi:hypothetical protein